MKVKPDTPFPSFLGALACGTVRGKVRRLQPGWGTPILCAQEAMVSAALLWLLLDSQAQIL